MVLEGAASTPDVYQDDTSPSSDQDPYSGPNGSVSGSVGTRSLIDLDKLPRPIPIIGPLIGFTQVNLAQTINATVANISKIIRRPLSNEEVQALAYHGAKATAIASWGFPVGAVGGLWRASNTRSTYRFPFWQPDLEKFNPKKLGPLTGARADYGWQFLRRFTYAGLGGWLGKVIVGTYAATVAATGMRLDSRLKDVVDALGKIGNQEAMRRGRAPSSSTGNAQIGNTEEQKSAPYYGATESAGMDRDAIAGSDTGIFTDRQMRTQESQRPANYNETGGMQNKSLPPQMDKIAAKPADFDFDDASPTAGNGSMTGAGEMTAWERLRKGQSSIQPTSRDTSKNPPGGDSWKTRSRGDSMQREQREGATQGDSFSFSKSDEERQLAQSQAQAEFDARLERERKGLDFSEDRKWR